MQTIDEPPDEVTGEVTTDSGPLQSIDGRDTAFAVLFDQERTPMVRVAYLLIGSEPLAEEIVQDAFAAVYVRWDRIDNPGGYLRQSVVNGARSAGRRRPRWARAFKSDGKDYRDDYEHDDLSPIV